MKTNMSDKERYVVVETGGSIGENSDRGSIRLGAWVIFDSKEEAKKKCRELVRFWGGGYYSYKYRTVTLEWAKKRLRESEFKGLI